MERFYHFAGIDVLVDIPEDRMYTDAKDLAPFEVAFAEAPHCYRYSLVDRLDPPSGVCEMEGPGMRSYDEGEWKVRYIGSVEKSWESAYMRAAHCGKEHRIQLKRSEFPGYVTTSSVLGSMAAEHLVAQNNGFVFHSSYIDWKGRGILFTAPSGTGKSTQADLWQKFRGAEILNGDRCAVRIVNGAVIAEGIPFSGSSRICVNRSLPLAAVVYLSQAPQTSIRKLKGYEAFSRIWEGVSVNTWDKEDVSLVSRAVEQAASAVPVYHLACTPDESAVIALERMLRE